MLPWGVAAAKRIGLYDTLVAAGGHHAPVRRTYVMGQATPPRDLPATTPAGDAMLNIYHPDMQEAVIARGIGSGAHGTAERRNGGTAERRNDMPHAEARRMRRTPELRFVFVKSPQFGSSPRPPRAPRLRVRDCLPAVARLDSEPAQRHIGIGVGVCRSLRRERGDSSQRADARLAGRCLAPIAPRWTRRSGDSASERVPS